MASVTIYGASDDLVEIEGDLSEEFSPGESNGQTGMMLAFGDGTILDIDYDAHGFWRITRAVDGSASYQKEEATSDEGNREDGKPAYSDIVTLTGELGWALGAERVTLHKIDTLDNGPT